MPNHRPDGDPPERRPILQPVHQSDSVAVRLRDPLGIVRGMAESIPDLVDEVRRLSVCSPVFAETSAVLDDLVHAADLISKNATKAMALVEPQAQRPTSPSDGTSVVLTTGA